MWSITISYKKLTWSLMALFLVALLVIISAGSSHAQGLVVLKETAHEKRRLAQDLLITSKDLDLLMEDAGSKFISDFAQDWPGGHADIFAKLAGASSEIERLSREAVKLASQLEREYNVTRVQSIEKTIGIEVLITVRGESVCQKGEELPKCQARAKSDLEIDLNIGAKRKLGARLEKIPGIDCTPSQLMSMMVISQLVFGKQKLSNAESGRIRYSGQGTFRGYIIAAARDRLLNFGECGDVVSTGGDRQLPKILSVSAEHESKLSTNCRSIAETMATIQAEAKLLKTVKSSVCVTSSWQQGSGGTVQESIYCTGAGILPPLDTQIDWLSPCKARVTVSVSTRELFDK